MLDVNVIALSLFFLCFHLFVITPTFSVSLSLFFSFNKKKYKEIMAEKAAAAAGKMNKRKHKFHKKK